MSRKLTAAELSAPDVVIEVAYADMVRWPTDLYKDVCAYAFDKAPTKTGYRFTFAAHVFDELASKYAPAPVAA